MVHSTRSNKENTYSEAILKGLAYDGGLYVFDTVNKIDISKLYELEYKEIAYIIFKEFFKEFSDDEIKWAINNAYSKENFKNEIVALKHFENYSYLELYHGPTAAFKDMALTILPYLMVLSKKKQQVKEQTHILVATSGDTGSATLSGFKNVEGIDVTVLYPHNLVSALQEKQMLYFSNNISRAYAFEGNFDDCQTLVKKLAISNNKLSSANSINIGRLIPQIVYYFYSYIKLVKDNKIKKGQLIDVSVPTGNFGNILACYIAKMMGLPIDKMICASNSNKVLTDFINTGIYDSNREFYKTYAPSMDIIVSSNIERLMYFFFKDCDKVDSLYKEFNKSKRFEIDKNLFKDFLGLYTKNDEIVMRIKEEYENHKYLIDSHTAVAYDCYKKANNKNYTLIVSTASPYKFEDVVNKANIDFDMSNATSNLKNVYLANIEESLKDNVVNEEKVKEIISCLK